MGVHSGLGPLLDGSSLHQAPLGSHGCAHSEPGCRVAQFPHLLNGVNVGPASLGPSEGALILMRHQLSLVKLSRLSG